MMFNQLPWWLRPAFERHLVSELARLEREAGEVPAHGTCQVPLCSRTAGHAGPCIAREDA